MKQPLNHLKYAPKEFLTTIHHQIITVSPKIITGVIVFFVGWLLAFVIRFLIRRISTHTKGRRYLLKLLSTTAYVIILLLSLITALGTMGIDVLALVTGLGLAGFAVGFALKDSLSNMLAGFMLLFYEPFTVDNTINVTNVEGKVADINLRYTVLHSDGKRIMVPNSTVLTNSVTVMEQASP